MRKKLLFPILVALTAIVLLGCPTPVTPSTDTTVTLAAIPGVMAPVFGAIPVTTITEAAQYTGTVTWSDSPATFAASTVYTATITLTAKAGYTLTGVAADFFTVAGATSDSNPVSSGVVTAVFPATGAAPDTIINIAAITGVPAPAFGATPVTTITETAQYTGTVTWSDSPATFAASTVYTATITLTAKAGYTLTGVAADFFTVAGATNYSNPVNSGVVTAVFPAVLMLKNGSFDAGLDDWNFWVSSTSDALASVDTSSKRFVLDIQSGAGGEYTIGFGQEVALDKNSAYYITFDASASVEHYTIATGIQEWGTDVDGDGRTFSNYSNKWFNLSQDSKSYSALLLMPGHDDPNAQLTFYLDFMKDTAVQLVLDNIHLVKLDTNPFVPPPDPEMIFNGDFALDYNFWWLWSESPHLNRVPDCSDKKLVLRNPDPDTQRGPIVLKSRYKFGTAGTYYMVVNASSTNPGDVINISLSEDGLDLNGDGSTYSKLDKNTIPLSAVAEDYVFSLNSSYDLNFNVSLNIDFGGTKGDITVNNISMKPGTAPDPQPVTEADVPDPVLRSLFEEATGKPFAEITTADLLDLTELEASHDFEEAGGLTDLTGIELCSELLELNLDGNSGLSQIEPIAALKKLSKLGLQGCPVADYSLLGSVTSLTALSFSPESTSSLTWLTPTNLPGLNFIQLHSHYDLTYSEALIDILDDFAWKKFWTGLQLNASQFDELFVRVLEPNINTLSSFGLYDASLLTNTSIDRVSDFIHLGSLTIWASDIDNLDFITDLTNIKLLDLRGNTGITDLSPIKTLHENGGLSQDDDWKPPVNLESLGMDLTPGSPNRAIVDYLIENGIPVLWETGNTVEDL